MVELLIIISIFAGITESAMVKKYKDKYGSGGFIFTAFLTLFSMIFFVVTDKNGFGVPSLIWVYGIPSGICYAAAYYCTFVAFGCGPFALSCLILSYSLLVTIGYGIIVRNDPATIFTYLGIILIMVSLYFINSAKKTESEKAISLKWIINIFIVWAGNAVIGILKLIQLDKFDSAYNNDFMISTLLVAFVILLVAGIITDRKNLVHITKTGFLWGAGAGILNGTHNALSMIIAASTVVPVSVSTPLTSGLKTIITFIFARLVFKEKYTKKQLIGVLCGLIAIVLLKL